MGKWVPFDKARASLYLKKCLFPSKSGDRHSLFLLKVPPKMKASKMCRVRVFFWVRNGHHHHFRNVMTSLYGYEVFPFFSHLRSIWSSLLIEAFACKRKKWSTFPSCHLFKAPFSAFFRRKKGGEFVFMNPKILFSFSPTEMKVFRFFFNYEPTCNFVHTKRCSIFIEINFMRKYMLRTKKHDTKANRMRQFFLL